VAHGVCNVYEAGANECRLGPTGMPETIVVHFPRAQMRIIDTWDVSGLSATGSHDVIVEDVFVPTNFAWSFVAGAPRGPRFSDPLYRFPFSGFLRWPIAAVALGIAQASLDEITETSRRKTPRGAAAPLREQPLFQTQLAQAVALVRSARAWLHEMVALVWEKTIRGKSASFDDRAALNLAGVNATRNALSAVELAYAAGGGSANYRKSPLQRHMRDIHAVTQHIGIAPKQYETSGRMFLGLQPEERIILL
jgi:indole-3-acetate monooxygenase